tara:strand:+ start:547 stop:2256 length:1710 start_codon:yes stop_codon:yes gene_type:complete
MAKEKINIIMQGVNNTQKAFNDIKRNLDKLDRKTKGIQKTFSAVAKTATVAFTAISVAVGVSVSKIDRLVKTAEKLGVSTEFLQKFRFAAQQAGIRVETADMAVQRFTRRLAEADKGTGEAKDALQQLGIQLRDSSGALRPVEEVLLDVADGIANVTNESEKVRLAFKFFDSEGVALVGTMKGGSTVLKEFFNDAESLGGVLSASAAKGVADFADETTRLQTLLGGVVNHITAGLAPALDEIVKDFVKFIQEEVELRGGFQQFGQFLANEFIGVLQLIIGSFVTLSNVVIDVLNTIRGAGSFLGLIEESERAKELRKELDSLGTIVQDQGHRGSEFLTSRLVLTDEEKKRRLEILDLLDQENNLQKLSAEDLIKKLDEIRNNIKDNPINLFPTETDDTEEDDSFGGFLKNAKQALEEFSKDSVDTMLKNSFVDAFKSAEDALVDFINTGKLEFKDLVKSLLNDLARIQIRKGMTSLFGGMFDSFDGGGYTGMGARAGGIDGKGGFPAILHPNETVIDHTKGQSRPAPNINFNIQATDASGFDQLLTARKNQIISMVSQAMNQKGKAGLI